MASFQPTGKESTSGRGIQALGSSRSTSATSEDSSTAERPRQPTRRTGASAQSRRAAVHSPWVQRLLSVDCHVRRARGGLPGPSWDLHKREERSSSTFAIRAWDVRGEKVQENNLPELRTPDVSDGRRIRITSAGERNIPFRTDLNLSSASSSRNVGIFSENALASSGTVRVSENYRDFRGAEAADPEDLSVESSQPAGSMPSRHFLLWNSADNCSAHSLPRECLLISPSYSGSSPKTRDKCKIEKSEMGKFEDCPIGAQGSMFRDDVLSSFEHMERCSVGKGLQHEVEAAFPYAGIKNVPGLTELGSLHDTCSTSSSALIKNPHCNNMGVSRPLMLENNSDENKAAIYGKYTHREKNLHVNKCNSQTFSGVKGIIVDGNSGLSAVTPNLPKTANLWTSRFKEESPPNKETEGGNVDGPLQGSSEDVIVRSITKDKGVNEMQTYNRQEEQPTLSSFLWLQHWHCSNIKVTQRLMKTCHPNQNCQNDSVIKGSIDGNTSDASGSLKIVEEPVKDNSVEKG